MMGNLPIIVNRSGPGRGLKTTDNVSGFYGNDASYLTRRTREAREAEEAAKRAENQGPVAGHGAIGRNHLSPNHIRAERYGTDSTYLARRILRDREDIHERMLAGEFKEERDAFLLRANYSWHFSVRAGGHDSRARANPNYSCVFPELLPADNCRH